jgi:hypothetical protein
MFPWHGASRLAASAPEAGWSHAGRASQPVIVAQTARHDPANDCATLRPLVDAAHQFVGLTRWPIQHGRIDFAWDELAIPQLANEVASFHHDLAA